MCLAFIASKLLFTAGISSCKSAIMKIVSIIALISHSCATCPFLQFVFTSNFVLWVFYTLARFLTLTGGIAWQVALEVKE